jgi:ERCC4-related helicase
LAEELALKSGDATVRLASALSEARVDLNPHQVEAAAFALESLPRGGCMLADEVGLGKTIEAGIVIGQLMAEGKSNILILAPATLRAQWQQELLEKFEVVSSLVDGRQVRSGENVFARPGPIICSHPFAANHEQSLSEIPWDLVVIDEAHRLRNAHRPNNKTGQALRRSLRGRPKLLLTATPLQNELLELFGLLSLLDEEILGPEHAFRSRFLGEGGQNGEISEARCEELKERISAVVHRTLRRQVKEYVRYTQRRSLVEDFAPSADEQSLYERVSEYLRRTEASGIEQGKRTLLTLVYRKLLASSTYAIAPTLRRLAESLEGRLKAAKLGAQALQLFEPEEAAQFSEEKEAWADEPAGKHSLNALQSEVFELKSYADQAERITVNAKGEALKRALDRIFTVARAHFWPEKAVVFTESRRTQEYLFKLLSAHGFEGKISLLSGDAGTPEERKALVDEFRHKTQILLSTEAGAEGLNLQFCNLVVNYDLPWNPQRVEQRIGRCHRYGQERDVLVLNFLNRQNAADARLYELLEKKLSLFDGVFGASDEILGALETGVDFEKRILDIYQSCRSTDEINAAFDALRADLEKRIDRRMTDARALLLERFDGDVRRRLKLAGEKAQSAVNRRRSAKKLSAGSVPPAPASGSVPPAAPTVPVRERPPEAVSYLSLDASALPAKLAHYQGTQGWWFVYRLETTGLFPAERLMHVVLVKDKHGFLALPQESAQAFAQLSTREETQRTADPSSVATEQERALEAARDEYVREAQRRTDQELEQSRERADRYAEECLMEHREGLEKARAVWEAARGELPTLPEGPERSKGRIHVTRLERDYRKKLTVLRLEEDKRYQAKDKSLALLMQRAKVTDRRALVASAYFWLD